jgi:hypothetical protein
MTMSDLAARLTLAADDLATMRAELAAESDFEVFGRGAAADLAAHLTRAWHAQHERLDCLGRSLSDLAADVRLAARRYDAADAEAAAALNAAVVGSQGTETQDFAARGDALGGVGAAWTP